MERSRTLVDKPIRPVAAMNLASVIAVGKVWMKQEAPTYADVGVVHRARNRLKTTKQDRKELR